MRLGYLIGALGAGGSERQLSELAVGMAQRGHQVEVACYDGEGKFDAYVEQGGAVVRRMPGGSKLDKLRRVCAWVAEFDPEILHGFMKRASSVAILANLPRRRRRVIASDLSTATYSRHKPVLWGSLVLFGFADRVVTQTERNRRSLHLLAPWLRRKVNVVRNGVDTVRFRPVSRHRGGVFRFVCVGSVYRVKNPVRVVEAVRLMRMRTQRPFRLDWFGRSGHGKGGESSEECRTAAELITRYQLEDIVRFHGEISRVEEVYQSSDALLHASLQEGIPNAVVEGMACGLPIVVSRVSDLPLIVGQARNGFVCDETCPDSIADAMLSMLDLKESERLAMEERSRELALRWFGRERFVSDYEQLYLSLLRRSERGLG